jgi:TetR/AcrR family transcriptional regulator, transcriptional repressor for nem operon
LTKVKLTSHIGPMARPSVKQQIINAGLAELHAQGYAACSVEDITKAAGVPKGSFYNHFASKEDFAVEAVRRYFEISGWPTSFQAASAVARLRAGFTALYDGARGREYSRGCMWGNLANEVADHSAAIRVELAEGLDAWSAIVTELVAQAQRTGEISSAGDPAQLGRFIVNAWEGALLRSRVVRTGEPIDDFFEMIFGSLLG